MNKSYLLSSNNLKELFGFLVEKHQFFKAAQVHTLIELAKENELLKTKLEDKRSIDGDADSKTWYFAMVIYKD